MSVRTLCNQVTEGTHNAVLDEIVLIRILTSGQVSCLQNRDGSLQVHQALVGVLAELRAGEGLVLLVPIIGFRVAAPDEATIHHSQAHETEVTPQKRCESWIVLCGSVLILRQIILLQSRPMAIPQERHPRH